MGAFATAIALEREKAVAASMPSATYVAASEAYARNGDWIGARHGGRHVIVFTDFLCAACRALAKVEDSISMSDPGVQIVERSFPHWNTNAYLAALALNCARDQVSYNNSRAALFAVDTLVIARHEWDKLASVLHLRDTALFAGCIRDVTHAALVEREITSDRRLGVRDTPSILVGDSLYGPSRTADALRKILARDR